MLGLVSGVSGGLLAGLFDGLVSGLSGGLVSGVSVGVVAGLAGIALNGFARHTDAEDSSLGPADVWCHDRNAGFVHLLVSGFVVGLLAVLTVRLLPGLASSLAASLASRFVVVFPVMVLVGLGAGLVAVLVVKRMGPTDVGSPGSAAMDTAAALLQLTIRHRTPLRLIAFLEDARSRHLLRTVGPVYQFRHATLQDRLARIGEVR
jgi:hypothetical protein